MTNVEVDAALLRFRNALIEHDPIFADVVVPNVHDVESVRKRAARLGTPTDDVVTWYSWQLFNPELPEYGPFTGYAPVSLAILESAREQSYARPDPFHLLGSGRGHTVVARSVENTEFAAVVKKTHGDPEKLLATSLASYVDSWTDFNRKVLMWDRDIKGWTTRFPAAPREVAEQIVSSVGL